MKQHILLILFCIGITAFLIPQSASRFELVVTPGPEYSYTKWYGPIPTRKKPQLVVWAEDREGKLLRTLYISERSATNNWRGPAASRPEALPVYFHKKGGMPSGESIDGISAATPGKDPIHQAWDRELPPETARIMAEVNISYDYNEHYPKDAAGVNGQPSLLFAGDWDAAAGRTSLVPIGTGDVDGTDGDIREDLSRMTSALQLIESIILIKK